MENIPLKSQMYLLLCINFMSGVYGFSSKMLVSILVSCDLTLHVKAILFENELR